jgi:hypothetical protein
MKLLPAACLGIMLASGNSMAGGAEPARVELVKGSEFPQLVLEQKAAERIGLKTAPVFSEQVAKRRIAAAEVTDPPPDAAAAEQFRNARLWVRLMPTFDTGKIDLDQPSRVLPIAASETFDPISVKAARFTTANERPVFYATDLGRSTHLPKRVLVELQDKPVPLIRVPTSATLYDPAGVSYVYVETAPLTYRRFPIHVADVEQDFAYLDKGPPSGSRVVEIGAPLLLGIEFKIGH